MRTQPKFKRKNPTNKEEKLIVEMVSSLDETTRTFMELHNPGIVTHETFFILRDAAIGYAGGMIRDLAKLLSHQDNKMEFLEESKRIFNCYMDDLK